MGLQTTRPGIVPAAFGRGVRFANRRPREFKPGLDGGVSTSWQVLGTVALSRRRSRSEAIGSLWWFAFAHGLLREAVPPPSLQLGKTVCSPEATALPGGGTVRGHTPSSRPRGDASVPSDRSGGRYLSVPAWPPRAAKGNAGDSGRIVRDETPACGLPCFINSLVGLRRSFVSSRINDLVASRCRH